MVEDIIVWLILSAVILGAVFLLLLIILALAPSKKTRNPRKRESYEDYERAEVNKDLKKIKEQISSNEESW